MRNAIRAHRACTPASDAGRGTRHQGQRDLRMTRSVHCYDGWGQRPNPRNLQWSGGCEQRWCDPHCWRLPVRSPVGPGEPPVTTRSAIPTLENPAVTRRDEGDNCNERRAMTKARCSACKPTSLARARARAHHHQPKRRKPPVPRARAIQPATEFGHLQQCPRSDPSAFPRQGRAQHRSPGARRSAADKHNSGAFAEPKTSSNNTRFDHFGLLPGSQSPTARRTARRERARGSVAQRPGAGVAAAIPRATVRLKATGNRRHAALHVSARARTRGRRDRGRHNGQGGAQPCDNIGPCGAPPHTVLETRGMRVPRRYATLLNPLQAQGTLVACTTRWCLCRVVSEGGSSSTRRQKRSCWPRCDVKPIMFRLLTTPSVEMSGTPNHMSHI